jgi:hypothetical protein
MKAWEREVERLYRRREPKKRTKRQKRPKSKKKPDNKRQPAETGVGMAQEALASIGEG